MKNLIFELNVSMTTRSGWAGERVFAACALTMLILLAPSLAKAQEAIARTRATARTQRANLPPRVVEAERFLTERGWTPARGLAALHSGKRIAVRQMGWAGIQAGSGASATWHPLGPTAVQTPGFGLVTGRVAALALDPSDTTGNHLYLGTTGGGVWSAQNAGTSDATSIVFTPLTDTLAALGGAADASISIGALTVQPGGTGVILAGTGDPNDVLDSYYGAGILRSTDGETPGA